MNTLSEWIRNLVVLVFVMSAAQLIIPTNNMRPYARFVLGLVIMAVLLTSLFELTAGDIRFDLMLFPDGATESALPYIEQGQTLAAQARERLLENDDSRLKSQVTSVAAVVLGFEPEHVTVRLTAARAIESITIELPDGVDVYYDAMAGNDGAAGVYSTGRGLVDAGRAARIIAGFVGVESSQVQFQSSAYGRGGALR